MAEGTSACIHEVAEGDFPKGKGLKARSVNTLVGEVL